MSDLTAYIRGFEQGRIQGIVDERVSVQPKQRWINDMISREAAIDAKQEFRNPNVVRSTEARTAYDRAYANGWNDCNSAWIDVVKDLPSTEPEIIRCKDCYHYPSKYADCPMIGWARNENDFCSKAERKDDD